MTLSSDRSCCLPSSSACSCWLPLSFAPAQCHCFSWQPLLAVHCPHCRCIDVAFARSFRPLSTAVAPQSVIGGGAVLTVIVVVIAAPTTIPPTLSKGWLLYHLLSVPLGLMLLLSLPLHPCKPTNRSSGGQIQWQGLGGNCSGIVAALLWGDRRGKQARQFFSSSSSFFYIVITCLPNS